MGVRAGSTCSRNERANSESSDCGSGSRTIGQSSKEVAPIRLFCRLLRSMRFGTSTIRAKRHNACRDPRSQVLARPTARRYRMRRHCHRRCHPFRSRGWLTRAGRATCSPRGANPDDTRGDPRGITARSRDGARAVGARFHPREGRRRTSRASGAIPARSRRAAGRRARELHRLRVRFRAARAADTPGFLPRLRIDAHRPTGVPDRSGLSTPTATARRRRRGWPGSRSRRFR